MSVFVASTVTRRNLSRRCCFLEPSASRGYSALMPGPYPARDPAICATTLCGGWRQV